MRVDFYLLSRDPVERAIPPLAAKVMAAGERLLVVSADEAQLRLIGDALWTDRPGDFLANGLAGEAQAGRQPILLSQGCEAANGARMVMFADGLWRDEGLEFARAFLLFGDAALEGARACWRQLGLREDVERRFWKQDGGKWREGP